MITMGDKLPEATLMETTEFGEACPLSPKPVNTVEAAKGKRIVIFGLPGAYTPTCSAKHVPGYLANLEEKAGKPARLVVAAPLPEDVELLPPLDLLADRCTVDGNAEGVDNPPSSDDEDDAWRELF